MYFVTLPIIVISLEFVIILSLISFPFSLFFQRGSDELNMYSSSPNSMTGNFKLNPQSFKVGIHNVLVHGEGVRKWKFDSWYLNLSGSRSSLSGIWMSE